MCGICGLWRTDGAPINAQVITRMNDRLAHRGPDGAGVYLDGGLGLGHRRLAILDLSPAGAQPMSYGDGRWWITFNGEIYNFLEVREELEAKGHRFCSSGDTEVILAAFAEWGAASLHKFNGMWAFAIWDSHERTLFLARDRFGIKPLFYLRQPGCFAFASEIKAFFDLPGFAPRLNLPVLKAELLDIHSQEGGPNCLLHDVYRLPAGHWLRIDAGGRTTVQRWWRTLDHLVTPPARLEEQAEHFRTLFDDACRIRMRSDVPIGSSLSGGLDSSAVVCSVAALAQQGGARQMEDWRRAFVATFPGSPVDERTFAEVVIAKSGVQPTFVEIDAAQTLDLLASTAYHTEQVIDGPLAALWAIYQAQRQAGVVVTLDGHGGDELLAGYPHYVIAALYDAGSWPTRPRRYREVLDIYRGLMTSPADSGPQTAARQVLWETHAWLRNLRRLARRAAVAPAATPEEGDMAPWFGPALQEVEPAAATASDELTGASLFRRTLYRDFHATVLPVILRNYDRMSMAHGVEVRMPFLDWRLVTYVFSLPEESLLGQGYTKLILRRALADRLPAQVVARRDKIGFTSPISQWAPSEAWRSWFAAMFKHNGFASSPLWSQPMLSSAYLHPDKMTWRHFSLLWRAVHVQLWIQKIIG